MISKAVMQPTIASTAARTPWRALVLITSSMLGPGVADTTNVIARNSHQVLRVMPALLSEKLLRLSDWVTPPTRWHR